MLQRVGEQCPFRPARPLREAVSLPDTGEMSRRERQVAWALAARAGNERAAYFLVEDVEGLVRKLVRRKAAGYGHALTPEDEEDACAEVRLLLYYEAVKRFDPTVSAWTTYVSFWIRAGFSYWLRTGTRAVTIPSHVHLAKYQVSRRLPALREELGREPTFDELRQAVRVTSHTLERALELRARDFSLDSPLVEGADVESGRFKDAVLDEGEGPEQEVLRRERLAKIFGAIDELSAREQGVVRQHFGLGASREGDTLQQIGEGMGLTRERVRQIEMQALEHVRRRVGGEEEEVRS